MEEAAVAIPTAPRIEPTIEYPPPPKVTVNPATVRALARPPLDGPGPGRGELVEMAY